MSTLSPWTLRFDSAKARWERLCVNATRHAVPTAGLVLPAEGVVVNPAGIALHYLEWPGPVHDRTVLFLHGGGLHAHTFDLVGNLLRTNARCIALDLRGHGDSDWADDCGAQPICDDIEALLAALEIDDVIVVGQSLGGMAAMVWAARRPATLTGLVVVDVAPGMDDDGAGEVGEFVATPRSFADLEDVDAIFGSGSGLSAGMLANLRWADDGRLTFKYDTGQFHRLRLVLGDDLRNTVRGIRCPTLVLRGERSKVTSAESAAELAGLIPGAAWREIPDAGHTIQSANPQGLATAVAGFLAGLGPAGVTRS